MYDGGGTALYGVVFSDGGADINVGTIVVDSTLTFKKLLSLISHMIKISPFNFSIFLAAVGTDRKTPITANVNLTALPRGGGGNYFFVKRTSRHFKKPPTGKKKAPPQNVSLLRRSAGESTVALVIDRAEYEMRVRSLMMERERFLMNMAGNQASSGVAIPVVMNNGGGGGGVVCQECLRAKVTGIDAAFHLCVHDKFTVAYRSAAGPISRPPAKDAGKK